MQIKKIWMDGKLVDAAQAKIHVLSHVIHYGSGVFEGIRLYHLGNKSAIFRLNDHTRRLLDSAAIYKMKVAYSQEEINQAIITTLRENQLSSAYIRPLVYRGYKELGLNPLNCPVNLMIAAWKWGTYLGKEGLEKGISACVSSWNRLPTNTMPFLSKACGNYLSSQLIKMEALENGFQEGIALDINGYISEGSGENIFVIKNKIIYTTPFGESILPGITRQSIIKFAQQENYQVIERKMPREFLYLADEIFLVGTAAEVTPVNKVDHRVIGQGGRGPITTLLQKKFFNLVEGRAEDKHNWLTFI